MKSGTEKHPNPHEVSLAKFLRAREQHVTTGYIMLSNGQIRLDPLTDAVARLERFAGAAGA